MSVWHCLAGCLSLAGWVFVTGRMGIVTGRVGICLWSGGYLSLAGWVFFTGRVGISHWPCGYLSLTGWVFVTGRVGICHWPGGYLSLAGWVSAIVIRLQPYKPLWYFILPSPSSLSLSSHSVPFWGKAPS